MKDIVFYLILMIGGLGTAYWASMPVKDSGEEKIAVFSVDPKAIASLSYRAENLDVKVNKAQNSKRYWVNFAKTEVPKKPKKEDKKAQAKEALEESKDPVVKKQRFLASDKLDAILEGMNPFQALRVIGDNVDSEALKEFGLDDPKEFVTVTDSDGKSHSFALGSKSYGSRNRFAKEQEGGRIILIDGRPFENLSRANYRLYERKLYGFNMDDVTNAQVVANKTSKVLDHTQRNSKGELQWSDKSEGAKPKHTYSTWMAKISRLRLMNFADAANIAKLSSVQPFLQIAFDRKGDKLGDLQFFKLEGEKTTYWIRSDFLGTFAEISSNRIGPIEKDIDSILAK